MAKTKVQKGSWKPRATYTSALNLIALVEQPERAPEFVKKKLTQEQLAEIKTKAEQLRTSTRKRKKPLAAQVAATSALGKQCAIAARYVINVREGLKRNKVSKPALKAAGVGTPVEPTRSDRVLDALEDLIDSAADGAVGQEITDAGLDDEMIARLAAFKAEIEKLDESQEQKKGERKQKGVDLRVLQRDVQDGANRILGLAHFIYAEDDDTLKLFTDCLPRSAGGTGDEVAEEEEEEEKAEEPTPA